MIGTLFTILQLLLALLFFAGLVIAALASWASVTRSLTATFADGKAFHVRVKRRRFPWPSTNVTFGDTVYEGGSAGINDPTLRHEATHVRQYAERGWLWVWTHPRTREAEAHAAEQAAYPQFEEV